MHILITGGTGLIGRSLSRLLTDKGYNLTILSRSPHRVAQLCSGASGIGSLQELDASVEINAVINLAGAPIADLPWTAARRKLLEESRIDLTSRLVDWINSRENPPGVLVSGSAIGWYGDRGDEELNENSTPGSGDFASQLCQQWEAEALRAQDSGCRVALIRTAPVMAADGGMLARLLPIYRLGLGGRLGNGKQWMPWIHIQDIVALFDHVLHTPECSGPYNGCAPLPVTNAEFTRTLAATLKRPALLPAPAWLLKLILGEMSMLLLGGQNLRPGRTSESGFNWQYPDLAQALQQILQKN